MPLQVQINIRNNIHPATVRRIHADAALIADSLECMIDHQVHHLRPASSVLAARFAARRCHANGGLI